MKTSQSTPKKKHGAARIGAGLRSLQQFLAERQVGIRHQDKDRLISEYRDWLRHAHESIGEADPSFEPTFKACADQAGRGSSQEPEIRDKAAVPA